MHAIVIPYGIKEKVDYFIKEIEHADFWLPVTFPDGKIRKQHIKGHVRVLPFGVLDIVFPKEYKDLVLTTLDFHLPNRYAHAGVVFRATITALRKAMNCKKPEPFNSKEKLSWLRENVEFICLGVRDDVNVTYDLKGEKIIHEAL